MEVNLPQHDGNLIQFSSLFLQASGGSVGIGIFWGHFLPQQSGWFRCQDGAEKLERGWKMRTTTPRNLTNTKNATVLKGLALFQITKSWYLSQASQGVQYQWDMQNCHTSGLLFKNVILRAHGTFPS